MWILTTNDHYRALENTGIFVWDRWHTEHLACLASELGDVDTEQLCDSVLAGEMSEEFVIDLLDKDERYRLALDRGRNLGWRQRSEAS